LLIQSVANIYFFRALTNRKCHAVQQVRRKRVRVRNLHHEDY